MKHREVAALGLVGLALVPAAAVQNGYLQGFSLFHLQTEFKKKKKQNTATVIMPVIVLKLELWHASKNIT